MAGATAAEVQRYDRFLLRQAVERLRQGLYDPLAVRLLTAEHDALDAQFRQDLHRLEAGEAAHLCVCGAYGQGKSHTLTYLREQALEQGYAVSAINLDPRETPWHLFREVYRALMAALTFPALPDGATASTSFIEVWQAWAEKQTLPPEDPTTALGERLPADMPHPFKAVLVALTQPTLHVPQGALPLRQYRDYRPADFPATLRRVLLGETVPAHKYRPALKYRQVAFYRQASLTLPGNAPFVQMVTALPQLFRQMGYKGWVLLFDEAEALIQARQSLRARNYRLLHHLLYPPAPQPGLYPVFAFTPDFFQQLEEEDYDLPNFDCDYAEAWRDLATYNLRSLSLTAWQELCASLIVLHAAAYTWAADQTHLLPLLTDRLPHLPLQDIRATLKILVDELDQIQQQIFFAQRDRAANRTRRLV